MSTNPRTHKESLQDQLMRNREQISELVERNRKLTWALTLHEECERHGIAMSDQGDIEFHLREGRNAKGWDKP